MPLFVVAAGGGAPQQVCDDCGEVEQWSPDGGGILYVTSDDPSGVGFLKVGGPPNPRWLKHPRYGIYNPRVSPDGGWVAFNARPDRLASARVFVARVQDSVVAAESEWVAVADDGDAPAWSPSSALLYFWSDRDGSPCLWAQPLDPSSKRPAGQPAGHSALPQPRSFVAKPLPRLAGSRRRARSDRVQSGRARRQRVDDGTADCSVTRYKHVEQGGAGPTAPCARSYLVEALQMNILTINLLFSTLVFWIAARIYLLPKLSELPRRSVLLPILLLHAFRHLGLMFLAPGAGPHTGFQPSGCPHCS
jgi:WD40-like Beta Propeller Repeat